MRAEFVVGAVTEDHISDFKKAGVEVLLSAGYDYKVPVPDDISLKCINFHPTLLPVGRGPWPSPYLLLKHPEAAGLTLHSMTSEWDLGDILLQEPIKISKSDDSDSLTAKIVHISATLSRKLLSNFEKIWSERTPMSGRGSYWKRPTEIERTITPHDDPKRIADIFRAFGKMTLFSDGLSAATPVSKVVLWEADPNEPVGTLVAANTLLSVYSVKNGLLGVYR